MTFLYSILFALLTKIESFRIHLLELNTNVTNSSLFAPTRFLDLLNDGVDRRSNSATLYISGFPKIVEVGRYYDCLRIKANIDQTIRLPRVVRLTNSKGECISGDPWLTDVSVFARVVSHYRGKKYYIIKYKPRCHYRKKVGFRASMTRIIITDIKPSSDNDKKLLQLASLKLLLTNSRIDTTNEISNFTSSLHQVTS